MTGKRKIAIGAAAIAVFLLAFFAGSDFSRPKTLKKTVTMWSSTGECTDVTLDLELKRYWNGLTRIRGTVEIDGVSYFAESQLEESGLHYEEPVWTKPKTHSLLKGKTDVSDCFYTEYPWFLDGQQPSSKPVDYLYIQGYSGGWKLEAFGLNLCKAYGISEDGKSTRSNLYYFYYPAKSQEEAAAALEKYGVPH